MMDPQAVPPIPFRLVPFSAAPVPLDITGQVARTPSGLEVRYAITGDLAGAGLVLPAPVPQPARRDGLWRTTCLELFAAPEGEARYLEVNLSPTGDWNAYCFDGYRAGMAAAPMARLAARFRHPSEAAPGFEATVQIEPAKRLGWSGRPLQVAVSAVLQLSGGNTCWALVHTRDRPDFHAREAFTLLLPA
jgi:hypothetical protein